MKRFAETLAMALAATLAAAGPVAAQDDARQVDGMQAARPAYLVVLGDVHDREAFMAGYSAKLPPLYARFGGEYLAVGRNFELLEGDGDFQSFVVSRWPSMDAARAFWASPEYEALRRARVENDWGRFDVFLLEGLPAPQRAAQPSADAALVLAAAGRWAEASGLSGAAVAWEEPAIDGDAAIVSAKWDSQDRGEENALLVLTRGDGGDWRVWREISRAGDDAIRTTQ